MTTKKYSHALTHGLYKGILALGMAFCLLYAVTVLVLANTVYISDAAHVFADQSQVKNAAANLPDPISIYTTSTFSGSKTQFDQQTRSHITNPNMIVIAIDTTNHHLAIVGGSNVSLSSSQYQDAIQSFQNNFKSGDYSGATVAAIGTLRQNLGAAPVAPGNNNGSNTPAANGGFSIAFIPLCCIGLLILLIVGVLFAVRRRLFGGRRMGGAIPYQEPYNQPFNQGYPPNYGGPGYYNQGPRQGMNPWAAGGLGAAAGGLIGYELGKEQGEDQARDQSGNQGQQGQGDFGGGASGDFGGGSGGDFGAGSSGDFGGGGGGDFGGGGGDFGGGGSGDF